MNSKQQWDHASIDSVFEALLDYLADLLDQAGALGLEGLLARRDPLVSYLRFAKTLEEELLLQWKIKRAQGMEALLAHQRNFLSAQLRAPKGLFARWARLRGRILEAAPPLGEDQWQAFVLGRASERAFYLRHHIQDLGPWAELWRCLSLKNPQELLIGLLNLCELGRGPRPEPAGLTIPGEAKPAALSELADLSAKLDAPAWANRLGQFWQKNSGGLVSLEQAFVFTQDTRGHWALQPAAPKKRIPFGQLYGIDRVAERLKTEAERFLAGQACSHVLLWGARGMGKSSCALALLEAFGTQGLRLVEVAQRDLEGLPQLFDLIEGLPERFVLFLDDFGFEPHNPDFKVLKSAFEGSLRQLPENLWLLATSNKKDLVQAGLLDLQYPEQRQLEDEARALGDRFGLKLHFERPVFAELKELFDFLAQKHGLSERAEELWPQFQQFAGLYDHDKPSGRTIEQFLARAR